MFESIEDDLPTPSFVAVHPHASGFRMKLIELNEMAEDVNGFLNGLPKGLAYTGAQESSYVDEVALLANPSVYLGSLIPHLVSLEGVEYFNNATDKVRALPFNTEYTAEYHFFRTGYPWRIELLRLPSGGSPAHAPFLAHWGDPDQMTNELSLVHFSFKCQGPEAYGAVCNWLNDETDAMMVQGCLASYGAFSYWKVPLWGGKVVYVKPRVNLREEGRDIAKVAQDNAIRRVDHSQHDHPATPGARQACRVRMREEAARRDMHEPPAYPGVSLEWPEGVDWEGVNETLTEARHTERELREMPADQFNKLREGRA